GPVRPLGAERALFHLLEAHRQHALGEPSLDRLAREVEGRGAGRAVVVDVDHRDARQANVVDSALPAGAVAEDIAGVRLLEVLVLDPGVLDGRPGRLGGHDVVLLALARLGELGHADADDVYATTHGIASFLDFLMLKPAP